jgi:hypothetical protein
VRIFRQYVDVYGLKYAERQAPRAFFPAHEGTLGLTYAEPLSPATSSSSPTRR